MFAGCKPSSSVLPGNVRSVINWMKCCELFLQLLLFNRSLHSLWQSCRMVEVLLRWKIVKWSLDYHQKTFLGRKYHRSMKHGRQVKKLLTISTMIDLMLVHWLQVLVATTSLLLCWNRRSTARSTPRTIPTTANTTWVRSTVAAQAPTATRWARAVTVLQAICYL